MTARGSRGAKVIPISSRRRSAALAEPTDEALVAAVASGDSEALGILYDRHGDVVYRFLSRMGCVDRQDAEDLVQEVFLAAAKGARRFSGDAAPRTWLLAIAANLAREAARKSLRFRVFRAVLERLPTRPSPRLPDAAVGDAERLEALRRAVAQLPHDLRAAFVMCDVEEIAAGEVASQLGVPRGTIYRRLHDARRALRTALGEERS